MSDAPEKNSELSGQKISSKDKQSIWLWCLWVGVLMLLGYGFYEYQRWINPPTVQSVEAIECNTINQDCVALFDEGTLSFQMQSAHEQIFALDTVLMQVKLPQNFEPTAKVQIDLVGIDEDMGLLRSHLTPLEDGTYQADVFIPICVHAEMRWQARVMVKQRSGIYQASFNFTSVYRLDGQENKESDHE
jgi:hypothetical protein